MTDEIVRASEKQRLLKGSIASLDAYQSGAHGAFISMEERQEQGLTSQLNADEQSIVRRLLALSQDEDARVAALVSEGLVRSHDLLEKVIVRARPPMVRLVFEPVIERTAGGVTWLFERLEVGLTGINIVVRLWAGWPPDTRFVTRSVRQPLQWVGFHRIIDSTGRALRPATKGWGAHITKVTTHDATSLQYSVTLEEWWLPGVAPEARSISLSGDLIILVDRWMADGTDSFVSESVSLGSLQCTIEFPEHWRAGRFRPSSES